MKWCVNENGEIISVNDSGRGSDGAMYELEKLEGYSALNRIASHDDDPYISGEFVCYNSLGELHKVLGII